MTIQTATAYAVIWEDSVGAAKILQDHERVLRPWFAANPQRAEEIRKIANELFERLDEAHHDATSGR